MMRIAIFESEKCNSTVVFMMKHEIHLYYRKIYYFLDVSRKSLKEAAIPTFRICQRSHVEEMVHLQEVAIN